MADYPENGDRQVSDSEQGEVIVEAVKEAVDDWVEEEEIAVEREGEDIVADEEELIANISIMVAIAVNQAADS